MNLDKAAAVKLIVEALGETGVEASAETFLMKPRGVLDSIGLVTMIVGVEERLADRYGLSVTLASEKAMSAKASPFRSVDSLADYVVEVARGG